MNDEYLYLWAQWGILNYKQYKFVLKEFGDLENAWKKITPEFLSNIGIRDEKIERCFEFKEGISFHDITSKMEEFGIRLLSISDDSYPQCLKNIADPPPFLFVRGHIPQLHKSIGVVGTRAITSYGYMITDRLTSDLTQNGFVIVSGLALGVDSCAHESCLKNGGKTIAVLGSGVDLIYPSSNSNLADHIIKQGGAIVSEYPISSPAIPHHFPERNRIISGLSRGVLVTEGGIKSGALITARLALEQGRDVFAVPNNITKVSLSGTNHLIRRSEAKLVEIVDHILEEYQMEPAQQQMIFDFSEDENNMLVKLADGGKSMNQLVSETSICVPKLSEILTNLSLKGAVREDGGKWVLS
ncbi:DNA-processing protein DprA [Candidatus Peregrinibacteria bacterium]|nr:DNA-processing protein DprA [Candidatus Peregrinibacteria bacterium]